MQQCSVGSKNSINLHENLQKIRLRYLEIVLFPLSKSYLHINFIEKSIY